MQQATGAAGQVLFDCQTPGGNAAGLHCYGPDQIRAAYQIQPLLDHGIVGKGRTIVIIGAYAPPNLAADLQTFDATWGLPDPVFQTLTPQGVPPYDPTDINQQIWALELALDTQWAHVVAPAAKIVVVEARSTADADVLAATRYAIEHGLGDVISMSFGEPERCVDPAIQSAQHALFTQASKKGITLVAGSGDTGAAQITCDGSSYSLSASSPASDPDVLAVGGTSLAADLATGKWTSESVWQADDGSGLAGGGGYSTVYPRPSYQKGAVAGRGRGLPDVAYNAGIENGVVLYVSGLGAGTQGFYLIEGGTSAGTPQWAGLTALAGQLAGHRIGNVNTALYDLSKRRGLPRLLHDVTVGNNTFSGLAADGSAVSVPGYSAAKGWDAASGLGSPIAVGLVPYLAAVRH